MAAGYTFSLVKGHPVGRRGVGFLEEIVEADANESRIDAKAVFDSLPTKKDRQVRSRIDHWVSGGRNDNWFHGWPNDQDVKECFCFKWEEKRQLHRFYGFLYHPQPKTNARLQICVLAYHDFKNDESTDRNLLLRLMGLRNNANVRTVIEFAFPDKSTPEGKIQ